MTKFHKIPNITHDIGGELCWPKELRVLGFLFLFALLLRLPFFFPAVLDWDESTFVLMGQSLLDGHLPYVELWDNKPPLAFAFYALVIAVFGKDLVGIRLAGTLCLVVTAFLVYLIGNKLWNRRTGVIAAALSIVTISLLGSGQATMTEHVSLVPLMGALYLLIRREASVGTLFLVGVLMAAATLVRLNIGFIVIVVGLYILGAAGCSMMRSLQNTFAYILGGIMVVAVTWLPYALAGQQRTLWVSMILAPLSHSGSSQYSVLRSLVVELKHAFGVYRDRLKIPWLNAFVWLGAVAGLATILWRWERIGNEERRGITLLSLFMLGAGFGILVSGGAYEHYLIQLVPFAALLAASTIQLFPHNLQRSSLLLVGVLGVVSIAPIFAEYKIMGSRILAHEDVRYGPAYEIAAYLKRENTQRRPVYLLTDHIVYWFIGLSPPTKITAHPTSIAKPSLLQVVVAKDDSTEEELRKVFRINPEFVVTQADIGYLHGNAKTLLEGILADEYVLATQIEGRKIHRKKPKA